METYIVLAQFTDQGIRNIKETTKRAEAFKGMAKKFGITIREIYWTMGQHDVVVILEAPDSASASALLLSASALGNLRSQSLRAYSADEMGRILNKMA